VHAPCQARPNGKAGRTIRSLTISNLLQKRLQLFDQTSHIHDGRAHAPCHGSNRHCVLVAASIGCDADSCTDDLARRKTTGVLNSSILVVLYVCNVQFMILAVHTQCSGAHAMDVEATTSNVHCSCMAHLVCLLWPISRRWHVVGDTLQTNTTYVRMLLWPTR